MRTIRRTVILLGCIGFVAPLCAAICHRTCGNATDCGGGYHRGASHCQVAALGMVRPPVRGRRAWGSGGVRTCGGGNVPLTQSPLERNPSRRWPSALISRILVLAQFVNGFGELAWFMPCLALTAFFTVGGVLLAGVVTQIVGWSKNVRTVRVIREAHNSASLLHRSQTWAPASTIVHRLVVTGTRFFPPLVQRRTRDCWQRELRALARHRPHAHMPVSAGASSRARAKWDEQLEQEPAYLAPLPPDDIEASEPLAPLPMSSLSLSRFRRVASIRAPIRCNSR